MPSNTQTRTASPTATLQLDRPGVLIRSERPGPTANLARFITAIGEQPVMCEIAAPHSLRNAIWRVHADLLPMPDGKLLVTAARPDDGLDPLALIPDDFCPIGGVIQTIRVLADSIEHPALRAFFSEVFSDQRVFERYWRARAPDPYHWPGGLALRSLEVGLQAAEAFESLPRDGEAWSPQERGVTLAAALVVAIGECSDDGQPLEDRFEQQRNLLELRHLELVQTALSNLYNRSLPTARALLALLFPRQRFPPCQLRTNAMHRILLAAHEACVAAGFAASTVPAGDGRDPSADAFAS